MNVREYLESVLGKDEVARRLAEAEAALSSEELELLQKNLARAIDTCAAVRLPLDAKPVPGPRLNRHHRRALAAQWRKSRNR